MALSFTAEELSLTLLSVLSLKTALAVFVFSAVAQSKNAYTFLSKMGLKLILPLAICLSGTAVSYFLAPQTSRIYYDEQIYMQIAQHMTATGEAAVCTYGDVTTSEYKCNHTYYNKQPNGFSFYLSVFYKLFGATETVAHGANIIAHSLTSIFLFFAIFVYCQSYLAAIFTLIIYNLTPMVQIWSHTVASEPVANLGIALGLLTIAIFLRKKDIATALLLGTALVFSAQTKTEMIVLPILISLFAYSAERNFWRSRWFAYSVLSFALLMLPSLLHIYLFRNDPWGSSEAKFSLKYFLENFKVNGPFYIKNEKYPALFSLFALNAIFIKEKWKQVRPFLALFLFTWGLYLFFYAGSYEYGVDVRYSVMTAIPLAALGGIFLEYLLAAEIWGRWFGWIKVCAALALLVSSLKFVPLIQRVGDEAETSRIDVTAAKDFQKLLPPGSLVFTRQAQVWLIQHQSAKYAETREIFAADIVALAPKYPGGLYFHWGYWCNTTSLTTNSCDALLATQKVVKLMSKSYSDEAYHLYKIEAQK